MNLLNTLRRDAHRILTPLLICTVLILLALWLPKTIDLPELAPPLLLGALGISALTLAHVGRRVLFKADLHELIGKAEQSPAGAGLCVLGLCVVLASLVNTFGNLVTK